MPTPPSPSPSPVGWRTTAGAAVLVTGSSGLVGGRLVEMLAARGARRVVAFDVAAPGETLRRRFAAAGAESSGCRIDVVVGDLTDRTSVVDACKGIDVVYHIAALVGPFHDRDKYLAVNYHGTLHVLEGCRTHAVRRLVYSSSPSTRFHGQDLTGPTEDQLTFPKRFMALYAETKALAEQAVTKAADASLLTISVAPHQVYGPHDALFLPSLLETMANGRLRVFGRGKNLISTCYVDNYCHGLLCGADALVDASSPALGRFYIVTDGEPRSFWDMINSAGMAMGFQDLFSRWHLPVWLLYTLAYVCNVVGWVTGKKLKLNPFNVCMLTIHRYFSIENARRDLGYEPQFTFEEGWGITVAWFKEHWLLQYLEKQGKGEQKKME